MNASQDWLTYSFCHTNTQNIEKLWIYNLLGWIDTPFQIYLASNWTLGGSLNHSLFPNHLCYAVYGFVFKSLYFSAFHILSLLRSPSSCTLHLWISVSFASSNPKHTTIIVLSLLQSIWLAPDQYNRKPTPVPHCIGGTLNYCRVSSPSPFLMYSTLDPADHEPKDFFLYVFSMLIVCLEPRTVALLTTLLPNLKHSIKQCPTISAHCPFFSNLW